jgi:hypothetical protein
MFILCIVFSFIVNLAALLIIQFPIGNFVKRLSEVNIP